MQTLSKLAGAVRDAVVSPVELVEQALKDIERTQPILNAFTQVFAEDAFAQAKERESQEPLGPLHGVPIAVKDLYDLAGAISSGCCAAYEERRASADSVVVSKLKAAGAIIVAKTNQHELACGATNLISSYGATCNPWDRSRITGGSSGGSGAAVAAGIFAMAMGSDTGGSIRIPASFCGVTGLKPTHGAVSLRGAMPMCPSLDTAGPLARSAEDCALVHSVIAGPDPDYLWSRTGAPREGEARRLGIPSTYFDRLHPETKAAVEQAAKVFESLGFTVVDVGGPDIDQAFGTFATRLTEVAHCYRDLWDDPRITPYLAAYISMGRSISGADAFGGRETGLEVRHDFDVALEQADVLLAPCTPFPAPRAEDQEIAVEGGTLDVHQGGCARLTLPVNVAGLPSVAFPVGFSSDGVPIGAQLIGADWSELRLCSDVAAYQDATDWNKRVAETA